MQLDQAMSELPLIAILRGVTPEEVIDVAGVLYDEGFRMIEVPLNSPNAFLSIEKLMSQFGEKVVIGAGTVTDIPNLLRLAETGAQLVVAPNCDTQIIREAKNKSMWVLPGVATPSEAFAALQAGADGLKLFPAEVIGPAGLRAWKTILPQGTLLIPVGGITPETIGNWRHGGASAFGIGSALYQPGIGLEQLRQRARAYVAATENSQPS
jgi:2-dehydro-3-deoxyphosphogalactonate aldolase